MQEREGGKGVPTNPQFPTVYRFYMEDVRQQWLMSGYQEGTARKARHSLFLQDNSVDDGYNLNFNYQQRFIGRDAVVLKIEIDLNHGCATVCILSKR